MITTTFAPNETVGDMWYAFRLLFQPWQWTKGKAAPKLRLRLKKRFFWESSTIHFTLAARSALYNFLKAYNLPENSEVLVQAFTCEAVILPILEQKLTPIFIDINQSDFSMDLDDLTKKYTPQAKVLILQHSFGITPLKRTKIIEFAKEKKLILLEDLAHGFEPDLYKDKSQYGSLLLSFGRSKAISSVFGGAIISRYKKVDDYFSNLEKHIRYPSFLFNFKLLLYKLLAYPIKATHWLYIGKFIHLAMTSTNMFIPEISKREKQGKYDEQYSKGLPNICGLFLLNQLQRYNDVLKKRGEVAEYYETLLPKNDRYSKATLRYPYITEKKEEVIKKAYAKGIILGRWYEQIVAPNGIDLNQMMYKKGSCPKAENICTRILNLPTNVTKKQAERIVNIIKSV